MKSYLRPFSSEPVVVAAGASIVGDVGAAIARKLPARTRRK